MKRRLWKRNKVGAASLQIGAGRFYSFLFALASLALIMFSLTQPQLFSKVRTLTVDSFSPVLMAVSKPLQDATIFARNITGVSSLRAENMRLYQENLRLREWYQKALFLETENKALQDLLNVRLDSQYGFVTGRVISDAGNTYFKSMLVSLGQADGLQKGQAVLSSDGIVGRVIEVGNNASRVLLVTDVNSRVPVMFEKTSQHAIMAGNNDDSPHLLHLPSDFEIVDGMRIVTSGQGGVFPRGLPVGIFRVDETGETSIDLFANMNRLVYVRVVNQPVDPNIVRGHLAQ